MTTVVPHRSMNQRMTALEKANSIRIPRAEWKRSLQGLSMADAREVVANVLSDPPEMLLSMRVEELLLAIPRMGTKKTDRLLHSAGASWRKRVSGLTERQRKALAGALRDW